MAEEFRRTWDKETFALKAQKRAAGQIPFSRHQERIQQRQQEPERPKLLEAREGEDALGITSRINQTTVVSGAQDEAMNQPGFYCPDCDKTYRDNLAFVDHLNSPQHLKLAGYSIRVQRSTPEQVKARLMYLSQRKFAEKEKIDLQARVEKAQKEEEDRKRALKEAKKMKKAQKDSEQQENVDESMMAMMGFGGFGSSKS